MNLFSFLLLFILSLGACQQQSTIPSQNQINNLQSGIESEVIVGAAQFEQYLPLLENKRVGLVVNQTSVVGENHLVDALLEKGITIKKVFAPEHGFRGKADAGESVSSGLDSKTGLSIVSLYGKNKKPSVQQLADIDVVVFDIQDVGARFYTYISTLEYVLQACAEQNKPIIVLDRPNPNGHYVDGPVLDMELQSFVGRQQIPIVHGMTVAEYAQFLNGEQLLGKDLKVDLKVILCENYNHSTKYELPIAPSPNLPNQQSILLYPSLCLFEGANVSIGRGTNTQFQVFGSPVYALGSYAFTPQPMAGAKYPKFDGKTCYGANLTSIPKEHLYQQAKLNLSWLVEVHRYHKQNGQDFFLNNNFFDKLAGTYELRQQLEAGLSEEEIRLSWQDELEAYKEKRKKYLLYSDFE